MPLPKNITKAHLLKAIEKIDKEGIPADASQNFMTLLITTNYIRQN